jgi:hypothetical protein
MTLFWSYVQFYSYFGSYDWVAFCWLFGKMINLPKHLPRYCRDLKQILDDKAEALAIENSLQKWKSHGMDQ